MIEILVGGNHFSVSKLFNIFPGNIAIALKIMNNKLGFYFNKDLQCEARKKYIKLAENLFNMIPYYNKADDLDVKITIKSFIILTSCCSIYESCVLGSYEKAMRRIERMNVIPLDLQDVEMKNEEFQKYDVCVKHAMGES